MRKSSTEAAEKVGTKSAPLIRVVMNSLPDSAKSQVIQAAAMNFKTLELDQRPRETKMIKYQAAEILCK